MEHSAESFALLLRLESVSVSTAAAVYERLAHLELHVVIKRSDGAVAVASIDGRRANRTLRLEWRNYWRNFWRFCDRRRLPRAFRLAGLLILEAILVALAAAVLELVAGIGATIVIELLHEAVARADHLGQRARI